MKIIKTVLLASATLCLTGCAAIGTIVSHGNMETQTLMSNSIFIAPVNNDKKIIYVKATNTTDKANFNIEQPLISALISRGYQVTPNPKQADFLLQVNLLQVGRNSKTAAKEMLISGSEGATEGAVAGAGVAYLAGGNAVGGALVGSVATTVANNAIKDVTYTGIVDIVLSRQKYKDGKKDGWEVHKTRILTTANEVNLHFDHAAPYIEKGLVNSIAGIM